MMTDSSPQQLKCVMSLSVTLEVFCHWGRETQLATFQGVRIHTSKTTWNTTPATTTCLRTGLRLNCAFEPESFCFFSEGTHLVCSAWTWYFHSFVFSLCYCNAQQSRDFLVPELHYWKRYKLVWGLWLSLRLLERKASKLIKEVAQDCTYNKMWVI